MDDTIIMLISIWLRVALCLLSIQIMRISKRRALWVIIAGFYLFFAVSRISQFTDSLFNDVSLIESEPLMLNVAGDFLLATSMLMLSLFSQNILVHTIDFSIVFGSCGTCRFESTSSLNLFGIRSGTYVLRLSTS